MYDFELKVDNRINDQIKTFGIVSKVNIKLGRDLLCSCVDVLASHKVALTDNNALLTVILIPVLHILFSNKFLDGSICHYDSSLICVFQVEFQVMLPQLFYHLKTQT